MDHKTGGRESDKAFSSLVSPSILMKLLAQKTDGIFCPTFCPSKNTYLIISGTAYKHIFGNGVWTGMYIFTIQD